MSSVSVDSAVIQKLMKNCSDTIVRIEKTRQSLLTKYQSLGASWSDSKYQYLGTIIEESTAAISKVSSELQGVVQKLGLVNIHIQEYEGVNFNGSSHANASLVGTFVRAISNACSDDVRHWNQQLDGLSERVWAYNVRHFSQYISGERLERHLNESVSFETSTSMRTFGEDERTLGFNDGRRSHVLVGTGHESATTVHENLHQLSATGSRHGIIERSHGERQNVQMNEAITEMLTRRTLGSDYGEDYSLYSENRDAMELIESCMGNEIIYEAYFQNRPELMRNQYESIMGIGSWDQLSDAFDDSVSNLAHDRTTGRVRRNNLIDEYIRLSMSNSSNSQQSWRDML